MLVSESPIHAFTVMKHAASAGQTALWLRRSDTVTNVEVHGQQHLQKPFQIYDWRLKNNPNTLLGGSS